MWRAEMDCVLSFDGILGGHSRTCCLIGADHIWIELASALLKYEFGALLCKFAKVLGA